MSPSAAESNAHTVHTYNNTADEYTARTATTRASLIDVFIAAAPPGAHVLELGSGPGHDAVALEEAGFSVDRTDAAQAFVDRLRRLGHSARVLDALHDDFGGPFDAVYANAVLLHFARSQLLDVLRSSLKAVHPGGLLVATVKKGNGEEWSTRKVDAPRHFTYWQEEPLRTVLTDAGWAPLRVSDSTEVDAAECWITVTAQRPA